MSAKYGPIIIIEDDPDDQELFQMALQDLSLPNKLIIFQNCSDALYYLMDTTDKPFIIISDINLPGMSGIEMRRRINQTDRLRMKSIPFVFLSTAANQQHVEEAYELTVQGFFEKPYSIQELKDLLRMTTDYWKVCRHPNVF